MDTKTLIKDAKARFSHNSAKAYLLESLTKTYNQTMTEWNSEWKELERKR